jgi:hypothetical protein
MVTVRFMSTGFAEFPQASTRSRQPRAHRADGQAERHRGVLIGEPRPGAESDDLALALRQLRDGAKRDAHAPLVVETSVGIVGEIRTVLERQALERGAMSSFRPSAIAEDVGRNTKEPGQCPSILEPHLASPAPCLEEDDRRQVLGNRPVRGAAEAEVVDRARVPLEQNAEGGGVTICGKPPELGIRRLPHVPVMSGRGCRVPGQAGVVMGARGIGM